jgi:hypothetical protein
MLTEFEILECTIESEKPTGAITIFSLKYESMLLISDLRYRQTLAVNTPIRRNTTCDLVFSGGTVIRIGHIPTLSSWQATVNRLLEFSPVHYAWGYHVVAMPNGVIVENYGNAWTLDHGRKQYLGTRLRLHFSYPFDWVEIVWGTQDGRLDGQRQRHTLADYQTLLQEDVSFE